jgi:CheY-like chemotaxis protein
VALVADDEPVVLGFAARTLEQEGWTVLRATDGDAVLRQVESHGAALRVVLLDLTMPGAPTREIVRRAREEAPDAAIVLSSGFTPDATLLRELGGLPFLAKPYRSRRLLEALGEALAAAAAREGSPRA